MLPKGSDGLAAFNALRRAHFGPEIDVALAAPRGTLLEPGRLGAISRPERQIELPLSGRHRPRADRRRDRGGAQGAQARSAGHDAI